MSLDGYIASNEGDLSFLSIVEQEDLDYGYSEFIKTVDTVIIGRKTYDKVISMGYDYATSSKDVFVITRTEKPDEGNRKFYSGDLADLVSNLKSVEGKNIYCDGGAEIVNALLSQNLIDEFIISIIPILLGNGIALFKNSLSKQKLTLISSEQFSTGLVQLRYTLFKN